MTRASQPLASPVPAGPWVVDPERSSVRFAVRHLVLTTVRGRFTDFDGRLETDPGGALRATGAVRVATFHTGQALRDEHMRNANYFDAARYPEMRFTSTAIERVDSARLWIAGELTIKGTTRPIELDARYTMADGRLAVDATGALRRSDFGIDSAEMLDAGIADRVTLSLHLLLERATYA
jgi:polyisoprenoid-binding protein YceI